MPVPWLPQVLQWAIFEKTNFIKLLGTFRKSWHLPFPEHTDHWPQHSTWDKGLLALLGTRTPGSLGEPPGSLQPFTALPQNTEASLRAFVLNF